MSDKPLEKQKLVSNPNGFSGSRRRLVKSGAVALPVVMTLRSGAALAFTSAKQCIANNATEGQGADPLIDAGQTDVWVRCEVDCRTLEDADGNRLMVYKNPQDDKWYSEENNEVFEDTPDGCFVTKSDTRSSVTNTFAKKTDRSLGASSFTKKADRTVHTNPTFTKKMDANSASGLNFTKKTDANNTAGSFVFRKKTDTSQTYTKKNDFQGPTMVKEGKCTPIFKVVNDNGRCSVLVLVNSDGEFVGFGKPTIDSVPVTHSCWASLGLDNPC